MKQRRGVEIRSEDLLLNKITYLRACLREALELEEFWRIKCLESGIGKKNG